MDSTEGDEILNDSNGNDSFNGLGDLGTLVLGGTGIPTHSYLEQGFNTTDNNLTIVSSDGDTNTATVSSLLYTLTKTGPWM